MLRRSFITGLVGALAAPAIIPIERLMPLQVMPPQLLTYMPGDLITLDDYSARILRPSIQRLAELIAKDIMEAKTGYQFSLGGQWNANH